LPPYRHEKPDKPDNIRRHHQAAPVTFQNAPIARDFSSSTRTIAAAIRPAVTRK